MKDLIEYIARSIVDEPDAVTISETVEGEYLVVQLHVAASDMGKVIGKQGRIAEAMRTLLKVASVRRGKRAVLEIA